MPGTLTASYQHCIFCLCCLQLISVLLSVDLDPSLRLTVLVLKKGSPSLRFAQVDWGPGCSLVFLLAAYWVQVLQLQPLGQASNPVLRKASCQNIASHSWSLQKIDVRQVLQLGHSCASWGAWSISSSAQIVLMPWLPKWVSHPFACNNYRFPLWFFTHRLPQQPCSAWAGMLSQGFKSEAAQPFAVLWRIFPPAHSTMATWWWHPEPEGMLLLCSVHACTSLFPSGAVCSGKWRWDVCWLLCCLCMTWRSWDKPRLFYGSCVPGCHPWDICKPE